MQEELPIKILEELVKSRNSEYGTKEHTVLRQLNTMLYAQLTEAESLRDIELLVKADERLQEYTGVISYSQLSRLNSNRDAELFRRVFEEVYGKVLSRGAFVKIPLEYGRLKVLDSTAVSLCLKVFPWAKYRNGKGGIKIHTLYDIASGCPERIVLTNAVVHDSKKMAELVTEQWVTYLFDRAYYNFAEFDKYCRNGIYFVSRLKSNAVFEVIEETPVEPGSAVVSDKKVLLGCPSSRMEHPVRLVEVIDSSNGGTFYIVTNRFDLTAQEVADVYRLRWSIETFFKWIKQHLRIKKFYSTTFNGILIQIYTALILYCLLKLVHSIHFPNDNFLQMLRIIAGNIWNTVSYIRHRLTPSKPPPLTKRKPPDPLCGYRLTLTEYGISDIFIHV